MSENHKRRLSRKTSQPNSPIIKQSRFSSTCRSSIRFADQNRYQKFTMGSRWKDFILPEFVQDDQQNEEYESPTSQGTFSRVESRMRAFTETDGHDFNHTADSKILGVRNASKQNIFNQYPEVSAFSLKKNRSSAYMWSNTDQQFDKFEKEFEKESLSSICKPYSIQHEELLCSVGVQTDGQINSKFTQQEVQSLKQEVDYLRKFVFSSFEDCFKKEKNTMETPKKQFTY